MKNILSICLACLLIAGANAQAPEKFSYQGVARNAQGQSLAAGTNIAIRFSIHSDNANGQLVYQETHATSVTAGGIFNVAVGGGTPVSPTFDDIAWADHPYFLKVEIDPAGGNSFVDMGSVQLLSTPYSMHTKTADSWKHNTPIVQKGTVNQQADIAVGPGARLVWNPGKAAFRAGVSNGVSWETNKMGIGSFAVGGSTSANGLSSAAFGQGSSASGDYSFAFGSDSEAPGTGAFAAGDQAKAIGAYSVAIGDEIAALGDKSFAVGEFNTALGKSSVALGSSTLASGQSTFSSGAGTVARAFGSTTIGAYNNVQDNPGGTQALAAPADRIFQIGNGSGVQATSNALTVLRNGNLGIGNNAINPTHILEVGGRARIRHSASTAGIYFDNSQNSPVGFVGMKNESQVGFYIDGSWMLAANYNGSGGSVQVYGSLIVDDVIVSNSDRRLKKNINNINNSIRKIQNLNGYHYNWIDEKKDKGLQTGVIAQEVEEIFPELVKTDAKGFKSVNYVGFIPHLIESVKELKKENDQLKADYAELKNQTTRKLEALEARLNSLVPAAQSDDTKTK